MLYGWEWHHVLSALSITVTLASHEGLCALVCRRGQIVSVLFFPVMQNEQLVDKLMQLSGFTYFTFSPLSKGPNQVQTKIWALCDVILCVVLLTFLLFLISPRVIYGVSETYNWEETKYISPIAFLTSCKPWNRVNIWTLDWIKCLHFRGVASERILNCSTKKLPTKCLYILYI